MRSLPSLCLASLLCPALLVSLATAQTSAGVWPITIDASQPSVAPGPADFDGGTATTPRGETIGMNARYLTRNGKPWLPVMGEFHYSRVPANEWEEQLLKMKAAGVEVVATYIIWIHHEEVEGEFDWSRDRDLRHFVELCAKHGLYVYPRIGPWDHGEVRNGGFPDWLLKQTKEQRSNDPVYLNYVRRLFEQIGKQLTGLMWKDGGPIIGVQLENEYAQRGPGRGEEHLLSLKKMAIAAGFDVPLYTVTGWDHAVVPKDQTVAVFGGYPDAPWDASLGALPPQEVYAFRFAGRAAANMGAIGTTGTGNEASNYRFPFMTAEMGGGVQDTYHRRPVIAPDDVAAMMPVMLGSGVNLYGSYMFQGGRNPDGLRTTLQESQATGYPNDLPVKSYDFQAPLSEFGEERAVLRKLKVFNYFVNDFGEQLAPMVPFKPQQEPSTPQDLAVARVSVRSDGTGGFLFFNNYVRGSQMPARTDFQVKIKLRDGELALPLQPVNLPSGTYGIWPFGLRLGCVDLRYATAQLFARTENATGTTYYFVATPGIAAEFAVALRKGMRITSRSKQEQVHGAARIRNLEASLEPALEASDGNGQTTRFVLLSQEQAENAWKLDAGSGHLLLTNAQYFSDHGKVTLQSSGEAQFHLNVLPAVSGRPQSSVAIKAAQGNAFADAYKAVMPRMTPLVEVKLVQAAEAVPPVRLGPAPAWRPTGVALSPEDKAFARAAAWRISIPSTELQGAEKLFLTIDYDGDVARLTSGGQLLEDNFYNGQPWRVGLSRFGKQIARNGLQLEILPRRVDAPIFLEKAAQGGRAEGGQIVTLNSVTIEPQYRLELDFSGTK